MCMAGYGVGCGGKAHMGGTGCDDFFARLQSGDNLYAASVAASGCHDTALIPFGIATHIYRIYTLFLAECLQRNRQHPS